MIDPAARAQPGAAAQAGQGSRCATIAPGDADAAARVAAPGPRPGEPLRLSGAQLVVAREHGFPSWPRLGAYVRRVAAHGPGSARVPRGRRLLRGARRRPARVRRGRDGERHGAVRRWGVPLTRAGARRSSPASTGSPSWAALRRHVARLRESGEPFARAYRAVEAHDLDALRALLDRFPELAARARDQRQRPARHGQRDLRRAAGRGCCSSAARTSRARTRTAGRRCTRPPTGAARRWRGGCSTPARPSTSPRAATAARRSSSRCSGATGSRRAARRARARARATSASPPGSGDVGRIERWSPTRQAGAHRAFYRPHSGFPAWPPADDPQEVLDEARRLGGAQRPRGGDRGARRARRARSTATSTAARRSPGPPRAAASGAIRRLLALGVDPNQRTTLRRPGPRRRRHAAPPRRAERRRRRRSTRCSSAAPTRRCATRLYGGTPADWAEHGGQQAAARLLRPRRRLRRPVGFRRPARR